MVIIPLELTRVNPDRNIFSINVELTSTFFTLQRFGPSPSPNFKTVFFVYKVFGQKFSFYGEYVQAFI